MAQSNRHDSREAWLRSATKELRGHFEQAGHPLPDRIRFAIALTSAGRNVESRPGECWHSSVSADDTWEIIIRADKSDPVEVLGILVRELVNTTLPIEGRYGKLYKKAAGAIGLQGPVKTAAPTALLNHRLSDIAVALGPLPHASLDIARGPRPVLRPIGAPKKQKGRMRKAECLARNDNGTSCGYTVRVASKWADLGPPGCPKHGAMTVAVSPDDDESEVDIQEEKLSA